jgi:hypothetical protein
VIDYVCSNVAFQPVNSLSLYRGDRDLVGRADGADMFVQADSLLKRSDANLLESITKLGEI